MPSGGGKGVPTSTNPYAALTEAQLQALADQRAAVALSPERAAIERAQAAAAAKAFADRQAIQGFGTAAAGIMGAIGPGIQSGYDAAARALSDLAGGFSAGQADRTRAAEAANRQFVNQQAPGSAPSKAPNADALRDVSYGLGGFIPSGALETQGAAANRWGQALPAIETLTTQQNYMARMAQGSAEDADYRRQLIDLAAKRPELRAQILDQLHQLEIEKFNVRTAQQDLGLRKRSQKLAERQSRQDAALKERAQRLYESQFGESKRSHRAQEALQYAGLQLRDRAAVLAAKQAEAQGRRIDASASRVAGHLVDRNGNTIYGPSGKAIPVAKTSSSKGERSSYGQAVKAARSATVYGAPVKAKASQDYPGHYVKPQGLYVARSGAAGYNDGTTDNPAHAKRQGGMTFSEAQNYLAATYGLSRAQARAALIDAGWKPEGQRPASGGYQRKKRG